ncbi:Os12g0234000 [Oryza sativa Japonica Group]|jgi:hypothetical protein|uniref:Os12g0234000 protein n=2 Tax=Oryza sativa subsp. japonica TaxID=39947 RepID=Q0IP91_ORYSJ|nr:hypothetical protein EE612_058571 [Oryza sativa]KAF2907199.1 hypothetical protein DAI22_12g078100 [Oryza sativa Japonica Group]BAF29474.1 Os12g0234000 [Oryza sativa Japonica Group]BAT16456.1 Os12g0234000 [Oryza sativa Japonica Group]|eukprot:NP_001066455.1 Os12g0234000 [Oryza sativa Japonica Group]
MADNFDFGGMYLILSFCFLVKKSRIYPYVFFHAVLPTLCYKLHQAYRCSPTISNKGLGILIFLLDPKSHERVCICVLYLTMCDSLKIES